VNRHLYAAVSSSLKGILNKKKNNLLADLLFYIRRGKENKKKSVYQIIHQTSLYILSIQTSV